MRKEEFLSDQLSNSMDYYDEKEFAANARKFGLSRSDAVKVFRAYLDLGLQERRKNDWGPGWENWVASLLGRRASSGAGTALSKIVSKHWKGPWKIIFNDNLVTVTLKGDLGGGGGAMSINNVDTMSGWMRKEMIKNHDIATGKIRRDAERAFNLEDSDSGSGGVFLVSDDFLEVRVRKIEEIRDRRGSTNEVSAGDNNDEIIGFLREAGCIPSGPIAGPIRWQAVFFIGPAGSGKSWVKAEKYLRHLDFKSVDPDEIKQKHPEYDPERPFDLHAWSKEVAQAQYEKYLTDGKGSPVIVDGTGRNWTSVQRKMKLAEENGYRTYLVYVYVPFEISIFRNRNRPRFVPEAVLQEQSANIASSFRKLKSIADKSKIIGNYGGAELKKAKKDMKVYPVPQKVRPPRPGDADYGVARAAMDMGGRVARNILSLAKSLIGRE